MANLTVTSFSPQNAGSELKVEGIYNFGVYATGGQDFDPKLLGMSKINRLKFGNVGIYSFEVDYSTNKVLVYQGASGASMSSSIGFLPIDGLAGVRIYYTPGVGTFLIGDVVTDAITGAVGTVVFVGTGYMDLNGVVAGVGGLFEAGDAISFGPTTGTVDSPNAGVPGSEASLYPYSFGIQISGPLYGRDQNLNEVRFTLGMPGTYICRIVDSERNPGTIEGEVLISSGGPNVEVIIAKGILAYGTGSGEVQNGINLDPLLGGVYFEAYGS